VLAARTQNTFACSTKAVLDATAPIAIVVPPALPPPPGSDLPPATQSSCASLNSVGPLRAGVVVGAIKWTRLSCRSFAANAVRLQLHALAYNLGNFMRTLAMPKTAQPWALTSLCGKLIKIGAKVVSHGRYVTFQLVEVAVSRQMFADILSLIARLRAPPAPA
jgi:hypothetical protein